MVQYRRNFLKNGVYFFTVTLKNRKAHYLVEYIDHLRLSIRQTQQKYPFFIYAVVILPDHLHMIWRLPENDMDYPVRWRSIKSLFTRALVKEGVASIYKNAKGRYNIWQNRYWEHTIRDEGDLEAHTNYIHYNPVKHGLVSDPVLWPYSSLHRFIKQGLVPSDWGIGSATQQDDHFGE